MSYGDVDRIARMVPMKSRTLADALKANNELQTAYENESAVGQLVDTAQGLEGIVHHVSTHAAGVLIASEPLTETVPLQRPVRGDEDSPVLMTQFSMDPVAHLGLLKMDFLGLTNLTILDRAIKLLDQTQGIRIDLDRLPLDDVAAFELLSSGNTTDLFQLESAGMQRYIKELKPSNLGDIAAMIALYRPGPMENIDTFIDAKFGRIEVTYPHPSLKDLLDETYGIIVYQDQVLLILQQFAGYTLGSADIVRKAMGKKIPALMAQERERFVEGARGKGFDEDLAVDIFNLIEPFAGYAFNKAHSVSYALISYWTAYFKSHYPLEYMTSVLNSRLDHPDKIVTSINECFRLGVPVLLPDINKSEEFFSIEKASSDDNAGHEKQGHKRNGNRDNGEGIYPGIRMGLAAVKTVGEGAVRPLVEERKTKGEFVSIDDFCRRADPRGLNRRTMESLIKAGAFDGLAPRGAVLEALDLIVATAQREARTRNSGQTSMFGTESQHTGFDQVPGIPLNGPDATIEDKVSWERELLGLPLSVNPLRVLASLDPGNATASLDQIDEGMQGQTKTLLGHVSALTERYTKEQKKFLVVTLDLLGGPIEVIVWPEVLERTQGIWQEGHLLRATGKIRMRADQFTLVCDQVQEYESKDSPNMVANGHPAINGNGAGKIRGDGSYAGSANKKVSGSTGGNPTRRSSKITIDDSPSRTVSLGVTETADAASDAQLLREVIGVILDFPGKDKVNLAIRTGGRKVVMELPVVSTGYCPDLKQRLEVLLGTDTVALSEKNYAYVPV